MTKKHSTKRSLIASILILCLCFTMLIGTTFAWFTDEVTSSGNKIVTGSLKVDLIHARYENNTGSAIKTSLKENPDHKVFDYDKWEPGYTQVEYFQIINKGTLHFQYEMRLTSMGTLTALADMIEVYGGYPSTAYGLERDVALEKMNYLGTVAEIMADGGRLFRGNTGGMELKQDAPMLAYAIAFHMKEEAGNEYQNMSLFNGNDGFNVTLVAAQMENESDSFGSDYDRYAEYPSLPYIPVTAANIGSIDFTEENKTFNLTGEFGAITISEIGEGSTLSFGGATFDSLTLTDDATLTGSATFNSLNSARHGTDPITLTITDAEFDITNALNVKNTDGKSILNIENSNVEFGTIFVGENTSNHKAALAEFNVISSYLSGEENGLGSTVAIWGRSGVSSKIYDSEIHTYSRGWHQSEDANDNSLTFQGATSIEVDIQRSNMHLYGARSIVNARQYGSEATAVNAKIDDSLIWVVTKSSHAEDTIPVWGFGEGNITDSVLLFTKNVYQSAPAVVKSFVYGNPVIHGNYAVTTQCGWQTDIALADGQTVTLAENANVSVYDGAEEVNFVLTGTAKVVLGSGATLTNIGVKAAEGYTLNTVTENGVTTYSVLEN